MKISEKTFEHLLTLLSNPRFLNCEILLNDLPLFIADYDIAEEDKCVRMQDNLVSQLSEKMFPC